jgi:V8-like Glu-specific endopeptidase
MFKFVAAILVLTSVQAFALPVAPKSPLKSRSFKTDHDFEGIVKLSNCSGALIKFEGMPETSKAVIMTNGHCAELPNDEMIKPTEVIVDAKIKRTVGIYDHKKTLHKVNTTRYIYATMTDTDVTLYELENSYKEIKDKFDIEPYNLTSTHPVANVEVEIISGYWDKGYDCTIEAFVFNLKEGGYVFTDSLRYKRGCNTIHGTSGSPIIERNTRNVIAINNTGNDSGERCTMNNPCEVTKTGAITARKGISYGQQTYTIYSCLNSKFAIDLRKSGCLLPKPAKIIMK